MLDFKDVQSELVLNRTFNLVSLCYALNEPNEVGLPSQQVKISFSYIAHLCQGTSQCAQHELNAPMGHTDQNDLS